MKRTGKYFSILGVFLLSILCLTGCGNQKQAEPPKEKDYVYISQFQYFYTDDYDPYFSVFGKDGTLYFAGYAKDRGSRLFSFSEGDENARLLPAEPEAGAWVTGMGWDLNGNLLLACGLYDETAESLELMRVSAEGKLLDRVDTTGLFGEIPGFEAASLAGDGEGNWYLGSGKEIFAVSSEGELLFRIEAEAAVEEILVSDGQLPFLVRQADGRLAELDVEKRKLRTVNSPMTFRRSVYRTGAGDQLLYSQGNALYVCGLKDKEPVQLLEWTDCDVDIKNLKCSAMLEDGRILAFSSGESPAGAECELAVLVRGVASEAPEKKTITYGCAYLNTITASQIVRFNRSSSEYRVEIEQYGGEETDPDARKALLQADIVSGKGPDVIDISAMFSEEEIFDLAGTGMLENLAPYFEKDEKIKREDYLEKVLQVFEKEDGLYAVMPSFRLSVLAGRREVFGENTKWTMEDILAFLEGEENAAAAMPGVSRGEMLEILCRLNLTQFWDMASGACSFNGPEFKRLLTLAARFPEEKGRLGISGLLEQGGEVLLTAADLASGADMQTYEYIFGEPAAFLGYPSEAGGGTIALPCSSVLTMSGGSENKEGAWELIRYLLEQRRQEELGTGGALGFPIHRAAFDRILAKDMAAEYEDDGRGEARERVKKLWAFENISLEYYAVSEQEAKSLRRLIESVGNSMETGTQRRMLKIIEEEAEPFFGGRKDVDAAAEIIQNRIQLLLDEL